MANEVNPAGRESHGKVQAIQHPVRTVSPPRFLRTSDSQLTNQSMKAYAHIVRSSWAHMSKIETHDYVVALVIISAVNPEIQKGLGGHRPGQPGHIAG